MCAFATAFLLTFSPCFYNMTIIVVAVCLLCFFYAFPSSLTPCFGGVILPCLFVCFLRRVCELVWSSVNVFCPTLFAMFHTMGILVGAVCLLHLFLCFSHSVLFICVRVCNIFDVRVCVVCLCFCVPS